MLRGLAGPSRSDAFDFDQVVNGLTNHPGKLCDDGPLHPRAMIVCATYFMLRELEASAVDMEDITLSDNEVTLTLPVSKADWQAKGCRRSWRCLCDKGLLCPYHILKCHLQLLRGSGVRTGPLFPNSEGDYCSKQGVVNTIRTAVELTGGCNADGNGRWTISGHTFRITGARMLSSVGLDPITVQLLGRWGSSAVLSYLAEAPLSSMAERMGSKMLKHWVSSSNSAAPCGELDDRASVGKALSEAKAMKKDFEAQAQKVRTLERAVEVMSEQMDGIAMVLDENITEEQWYVENVLSEVIHRAIVQLNCSPAEWRTLCGWEFPGRRHAKTYRQKYEGTCRKCPKCFPPAVETRSSSDSDNQ